MFLNPPNFQIPIKPHIYHLFHESPWSSLLPQSYPAIVHLAEPWPSRPTYTTQSHHCIPTDFVLARALEKVLKGLMGSWGARMGWALLLVGRACRFHYKDQRIGGVINDCILTEGLNTMSEVIPTGYSHPGI
jgi:hypothetical protein